MVMGSGAGQEEEKIEEGFSGMNPKLGATWIMSISGRK